MVSAGSNLTPADWPIVRTRGDSMIPEEFTLTIDGTALTPTSAIAQVRTARSREATLVLELSVDLSSNVVTVGDGDDLDDVAADQVDQDADLRTAVDVLRHLAFGRNADEATDADVLADLSDEFGPDLIDRLAGQRQG